VPAEAELRAPACGRTPCWCAGRRLHDGQQVGADLCRPSGAVLDRLALELHECPRQWPTQLRAEAARRALAAPEEVAGDAGGSADDDREAAEPSVTTLERIVICSAARSGWLERREVPRSGEHFRPGSVEPDDVVPTFGDRQEVRSVVVAAEVDGDRAVVVPGGRHVVDAVGVAVVRLEEAVRVVDGDRPEAVDGDIPDGDLVLPQGATVEVDVPGLAIGQSAPSSRGCEQVTDRVDLIPSAERMLEPARVLGQLE